MIASGRQPTSPRRRPRDDWRLRLPEAKRRRLRVWLCTIAVMTLAVLMLGGMTRLTHSGLSIVEWQPVSGVVPPLTEAQWTARFEQYQQFPEYRQLRHGMTLEEFKVIFCLEYVHRLVARLIGLVFLVPFIFFWWSGYLTPPLLRRTLAIFGIGGLQGAMGWLMVHSGLIDRPSVSHYRLAAHLSLAFVIVGLCVWLVRDLSIGRKRVEVPLRTHRLMGRGLAVIGALLAAQIVWGAFVAGLKAGWMFNTFPLMAGHVVPPLLLSLDPGILNFVQNAVAVQWMHRLLGTALLVATWVLFIRVRRAEPDRVSRGLNRVLLAVTVAQYLLGVATLLWFVPLGLAVIHQATAMAMFGIWVVWAHHVRNLWVPSESGDEAGMRLPQAAAWVRHAATPISRTSVSGR